MGTSDTHVVCWTQLLPDMGLRNRYVEWVPSQENGDYGHR